MLIWNLGNMTSDYVVKGRSVGRRSLSVGCTVPWRRRRGLYAALKEDGESLWFLHTGVTVPGSLGSVLTATWTRCCCSAAWLGQSRDRFAGVQRAQRQVRCMGTCLIWKSGVAVLRLPDFVNTDLASFGSLSWYRSAWRCSCEKEISSWFCDFFD